MQESKDIKSSILEAINTLLNSEVHKVTNESPLIGGDSCLDSMKLVELCLLLEDMALELGFEFDWTSDAAMSTSRSMFRTAGSLTEEFVRQMEASK